MMLTCLHNSDGVCWLCSYQDPRWRGWRVVAGILTLREPPARPHVFIRCDVRNCIAELSFPSGLCFKHEDQRIIRLEAQWAAYRGNGHVVVE